jgi:hypothetical protein
MRLASGAKKSYTTERVTDSLRSHHLAQSVHSTKASNSPSPARHTKRKPVMPTKQLTVDIPEPVDFYGNMYCNPECQCLVIDENGPYCTLNLAIITKGERWLVYAPGPKCPQYQGDQKTKIDLSIISTGDSTSIVSK